MLQGLQECRVSVLHCPQKVVEPVIPLGVTAIFLAAHVAEFGQIFSFVSMYRFLRAELRPSGFKWVCGCCRFEFGLGDTIFRSARADCKGRSMPPASHRIQEDLSIRCVWLGWNQPRKVS